MKPRGPPDEITANTNAHRQRSPHFGSSHFGRVTGAHAEEVRGPRPQARHPAQQSRQSQSGPASARQGGRCWAAGSVGRQEPHQSRPLQRMGTRCEVGSCFGSSQGRWWSGSHSAPEFVEECKTSSTGARSGCPVEPVRAIRCQASEEVGSARRGEGPSGFRVAGRRKSSPDCERQPQWPEMSPFHSQSNQMRECKLLVWREMVKVLQDERDALLATRPGSCGAFPLPESFSELSTHWSR